MCDWVYKCRYDITLILNDHYNDNKKHKFHQKFNFLRFSYNLVGMLT